jgi:hypothetical protein
MVSKLEMNSLDIHNNAMIVDMHAHPSLKISLFNRMLTSRFRVSRSFDPFSVRTDFNRLKAGGVNVLLSAVYAPERGIIRVQLRQSFEIFNAVKVEKGVWSFTI